MNYLLSSFQYCIKLSASIGRIILFFFQSIYNCFTPPYYFDAFLKQLFEIGFLSLPIVGLTAIFSGAVLIMQSTLHSYSIDTVNIMPGVVVISITRELGPVLIGLILAGRVGASIAAEIGTMRITEQIDALVTLDTHPFKYLITPRIFAASIAMPLLVLCVDLIGTYGGYLVAVYKLHYNSEIYIKDTIDYFKFTDILIGLVKALVFGFVISFTGCYYGYNCDNSAKGVGEATTFTMVSSATLIILLNYIITSIFI